MDTPDVLLALHKPYGVLSQFTLEPGSRWGTLADFALPADVYPIGRLDADSEGLLLLTDEKHWVDRLLNPRHAHEREYWVQVEGVPSESSLVALQRGVRIGEHSTLPAKVLLLDPPPAVEPRDPPIRFRKSVPDSWLSLSLHEGKNRQVRRMTAAVGHPTLRLIRTRIGALTLQSLGLPRGKWLTLSPTQIDQVSQRQVQ